MRLTSIIAVLNNIRITTDHATSQPDKTLLFKTEVILNFHGKILSSELQSSYAKKNFQSYKKNDLLRIEGLNQGPGPHEITFIFIIVGFKK